MERGRRGQFIEVTSNTINNRIILGNIYQLPGDTSENYQTVIEELSPKLVHLHIFLNDVIINQEIIILIY